MTGEVDPWREVADACAEHDPAHLRRALEELVPLPRYEECHVEHIRPGGERVVCVRIAGHPGRHTALTHWPPLFTWDSPPDALIAAVGDDLPHCLGGNCSCPQH